MDSRNTFNKVLLENKEEVLAMGSMVEKALGRSIEALKKRDPSLGHQIIADDTRINAKRFEIENKCIELIAAQQPVASDLRAIVAIFEHNNRTGTHR